MRITTNEELLRIASHLSELIDTNPTQAIEEARRLRGERQVRLSAQSLRAGILIDSGGQAGNSPAVKEGIKILQKLTRTNPEDPLLRYNLANGLSQLAKLERFSDPGWYVTTHTNRKKARRIYQEVINDTESSELQAKALVNLGNEMDTGFRWVEAYDHWVQALETDPSNGVAAFSATNMLLRRIREPGQHPSTTRTVAGYYARLAKKLSIQLEQLAGRNSLEHLQALPTFRSSWKPRPFYKLKGDFARFVARHRLALVGTVEGLDMRKKRWDDVHIPSVSEKIGTGRGVPPVFAMFNQLKADFCTARWFAYISDSQVPQDTSLYMDTLDYSLYGNGPSFLVLAQRAALDIIDRVAVCANEYFNIGDEPNKIHFRTFWRENWGAGKWRDALWPEILAGNLGIIALGELASDLSDGGALTLNYDLRNVSTHRFCVLHDIGITPSRPSPSIEHHGIERFNEQTIETLQIVRSAILYLLDAIAWRELRVEKDRPALPMSVLPHHYIRGEDEI